MHAIPVADLLVASPVNVEYSADLALEACVVGFEPEVKEPMAVVERR